MRQIALLLLAVASPGVLAEVDAKEPIDIPRLTSPILLHELHVWRDGGSLGFVVGDQSGRKIKFVVNYKVGSSTRGWFFLNTIHTDYGKGVQLPLGGVEEKQLLKYLSLWLDDKFDRKELERISSTKDYRHWTKDQFSAVRVKQLLDHREKAIDDIRKAQQNTASSLHVHKEHPKDAGRVLQGEEK